MRASSVILSVLCAPCICVIGVCTACFRPLRLRRRCDPEQKRRFEERQRHAPRPVVVRKRALTIPLEAETSLTTTQKTLDQSQSHLLSLPLELREMIYKYVLGDTVLHIVHKERKLGHLRCKAVGAKECPLPYRDGGPIRESCWGNVDSGNIMTGQVTTDGDIIPFLRTCRQIYSEAICLLYSTNLFSFADPNCIRHLSATILPSRLNSIKSISIDWYFYWHIYDDFTQQMFSERFLYPPHDEATWEDMWRIIASMKGLKSLKIELSYFDSLNGEREAMMLAPLGKVMGLDNFEVHLPYAGPEYPDASFRLIRPVSEDSDSDASD